MEEHGTKGAEHMNYDSSTDYIYKKLEKAIGKGIPYTSLALREWIEEDFTERFFRYLEDKLGKDLFDGSEYEETDKISLWKKKLKERVKKKNKDLPKEQHIEIDKNVYYKWFPTDSKEVNDPISGNPRTRPKIYCLAYVLDLKFSKNTEKDEISGFFSRVFRTRAYDLREKQEFVWYYYLCKGHTDWYPRGLALYKQLENRRGLWDNAISALDDLSTEKLQGFFTADIKRSIKNIQTEEQLESFILLNWETLNEEHQLLTAINSVHHLAEQAEYWAEIECDQCPEKNITQKSFSRDSKRDDEWADPSSNFLLSTITGVNARLDESAGKKMLVFPAYYDLDNALKGRKVSATTLRKLIIILELYCYTYSKIFFNSRPSCFFDEERKYSKETCKKHINFTLTQAGFYPLYVYDQFDLPILYAIETGSSNPIEELRKIIKEIYI